MNTKYQILNITKKGFSLLELLLVLAISGVLISIVFGSVSASRAAARDLRRVSDIKQIQLGLALYFDKWRFYPQSTSGVIGTDLLVLSSTEKLIPASFFSDPQISQFLSTYKYVASGANPKTYCLGALLEGTPANFDGNTSCVINGTTASWYKVQNSK